MAIFLSLEVYNRKVDIDAEYVATETSYGTPISLQRPKIMIFSYSVIARTLDGKKIAYFGTKYQCVRRPSNLDLTRSIWWLLMHQQPWYWLCRIGRSLSYLRKGFNYPCLIIVDEWHKCKYMFMFPLKNLAGKGLKRCDTSTSQLQTLIAHSSECWLHR